MSDLRAFENASQMRSLASAMQADRERQKSNTKRNTSGLSALGNYYGSYHAAPTQIAVQPAEVCAEEEAAA